MDTRDIPKIEKAVEAVNAHYKRVLVCDCYEGYELRKLREALAFLLAEVDKK